MNRFLLIMSATLTVCHCVCSSAQAQMFGSQRSFGQSLQPQSSAGGGSFGRPTPAPGIGSNAGPVGPSVIGVATPDARFMRGNRKSSDFVGQDTNDARKVVGAVQIPLGLPGQPAALEVRERRVPETLINPTRTATSRTRMYEPKMVVGFAHAPRTEADINRGVLRQIQHLTQLDPSLQISTTVVGETVYLRGVVGSEEERALIEHMMLFEPGISSVQNDLTVPSVVPPRPAVD